MNNKMTRPLALVTNDDGIESCFLQALIQALETEFEVAVAAPKSEQSWVGKAVSRNREVTVEAFGSKPRQWAIDGTPTDCINIALDHLLECQPDIVISGINIGYNTTYSLLYSSGTVAGAAEGAAWGIPAMALSMVVDRELFIALRDNNRECPERLVGALQAAGAHATAYAQKLLNKKTERLSVYNVNYPEGMSQDTLEEVTKPADIFLGGLFDLKDGVARFRFREGREFPCDELTDREALENGKISITKLDFRGIA
ncbi:MAG: 5'/3'-nucleotidase SurE [Opitutales bacterium]|nr:5'/3'-nucleotidase SurE [Opitutales bacterium]